MRSRRRARPLIAARAGWAVALGAALAVAACDRRGADPPKVPLGTAATTDSARAMELAHGLLGPAAKAALDSGNVLFKRRAYAAALGQYRAAAGLAPQHAAPLFGIYMVARATNDSALADSALAGIRLRAGPMPAGPHSFSDTALQRVHAQVKKKPSAS